MRIRSITCFINIEKSISEWAAGERTIGDRTLSRWELSQSLLRSCGDFLAAARRAFEAAGYEVQTTRLATDPFASYLPPDVAQPEALIQIATALEKTAAELGIEYVSVGPALPDQLNAYQAIPPALAATQNVFFSGLMTTAGGGVSLPAVKACARVIHQAGKISPDGFANLRFAALANVPAGAPFFPAAYHSESGAPAFSLALEAADLAVAAAGQAASLDEMRKHLIASIEGHALKLSGTCREIARQNAFAFTGLDFTLAPFPEQAISIGAALERMGVPAAGLHGSLAGIAFLADTLDRASYPRAGFNGMMLPVLEDAVLAQRAEEGLLGIKDLLLFSTVCGTGLDTLPIPGEASVDQIYALLLDLAALAQRLDKPLTARLMPIPGKAAGNPTGFDFAFFANSRVLPLQARPLGGLLGGDETFYLKRRA